MAGDPKIYQGAFPYQFENLSGAKGWEQSTGMTLRDYFAAQVLAAMLGGATVRINGRAIRGESEFATAAYAFADAMLAERAK